MHQQLHRTAFRITWPDGWRSVMARSSRPSRPFLDLVGGSPCLQGNYSRRAAGFGLLPGLPFLEHREQGVPHYFVEASSAGMMFFDSCEQGVE